VSITIYHNPACGTSRNVLGLIRNSGEEPAKSATRRFCQGRWGTGRGCCRPACWRHGTICGVKFGLRDYRNDRTKHAVFPRRVPRMNMGFHDPHGENLESFIRIKDDIRARLAPAIRNALSL